MFQFPAFASRMSGIISLQDIGLSHSEINGSMVICTYPSLIAAYHVLHRLREPRHPPCALNYFLYQSTLTFSLIKNKIKSSMVVYILLALYFIITFWYHHVKDRCGIYYCTMED